MIHLEQFIPEDVCLSCDGCCRYPEQQTPWAPLFLFEEIVELTEKNIVPSCLFTHADSHLRTAARIDLIELSHLSATSEKNLQRTFICPCFGPKQNQCHIYPYRPLDCQLYPFLLVRRETGFYLAIDEKCPYTQKTKDTSAFKDYVQYLSRFFSSQEGQRLVRNNPEIIQAYPSDLKIVAPLL